MSRYIYYFGMCFLLLGCSPNNISVQSAGSINDFSVDKIAIAIGNYRIQMRPGWGYDRILLGYNRAINDADFVTWLKTYSEEDNEPQFFYIRSFPEHSLISPSLDADINIVLVYGSMWWYENGLSKEQKIEAEYIRTSPSGRKVFNWGDDKSMYYHIGNRPIESVMTTPLSWQKLPMLEITKEQYELLDKRCGWPWRNVRCFIDRDFPGLTPEQLEYVIAHEHEDDQDRLNGKVPMPEQPRSNPYK